MTHWGWYWKVKRKHIAKPLCSDFPFLDSFALFQNQNCLGFKIENPFEMIARYRDNKLNISTPKCCYSISVEKLPCHFGGERYYFHCPKCDKRMRKLYGHKGIFLCRKCMNLGYYLQRVTPCKRYILMRDKINERLKAIGASIYEKPKGKQRKLWQKLQGRYWDYDAKHEEAFSAEAIALFGKKFFRLCPR